MLFFFLAETKVSLTVLTRGRVAILLRGYRSTLVDLILHIWLLQQSSASKLDLICRAHM